MRQPGSAVTTVPTGWGARQLADFLAAISSAADEQAAIDDAIGAATTLLEADFGAILGAGGRVLASSGSPPTAAALRSSLAEAAAVNGGGEAVGIEVEGIGRCLVLVASIDDERLGDLLLARREHVPFGEHEHQLAEAMARALALTGRLIRVVEAERGLRELSELQIAENERLVESLAERQRLLERLSKIQSSIVRRSELDEVLDAIVLGAEDLLGDETTGLRLIDPEDPSQLVMVASSGVGDQLLAKSRRSPLGMGAGGRAAAEGRLIVIEDYGADQQNHPAFAADGIRAALAAPVRERGAVVGSLVVATHRPGRTYSQAEREMLVAFAEHASLALTDAKTVEGAIHQAFHDSLTGLPNRLLLMDRLEQALARAARTDSRVAVLFVDLDTFKNINDSLGHVAGDELLREAARRLLACVRTADTAARFGGDEFVVVLEDADEPAIGRAADRILEAMHDPFEVKGREVLIGASIGIAIGSSEADDLLRNADLALYRAKAKGRGRKQMFEPAMHVAMVERMELEAALAQALRGDELLLHYQPIVDLVTHQIAGVEALVRWQHPTRGLLLPGEFIPIAEGSRLILPLGRWVLQEACEQAARWNESLGSGADLAISVNFSSAQFADVGLTAQVESVLAASGLAADRLILELTETALMHDADAVTDRMTELKRLGVRIAVDDFGTGNASLRHLARFPVDVLKVDRSFVERIGVDRRQTVIAGSVIELGEGLDMVVIAEGIETADQLAKLITLHCAYGQGFYLAPPVPADQVEPLLASLGTAAALPS